MAEPRPCPYCSSTGPQLCSQESTRKDLPFFFVECVNCSMRGPRHDEGDEAERIWNLLPRGGAFDLAAHLERQRTFSRRTFGPGARTKGVIDHIRKELKEIEADPADIREWVDVIILAFDGAWRAGWEPNDIIEALVAKQTRNEARSWPDWRTADPEKAIEHVRSGNNV